MKDVSVEFKVGIFAIIVIMVLTYMTFKVGSLPLIWEKGYRLYVVIDDTSGLDEKSRIKIAGVEAGMVEKIDLVEGRAKITLILDPEVKIYQDAEVSLRMAGLLGDRDLAITIGSKDMPLLKNGDSILNIRSATNIDMLAGKLSSAASNIGDLTNNINSMFGEDERNAIKEAIINLRDVTGSLKEIAEQNREPLNNIIARLDTFTEALDDDGPTLIDDLTIAVKELKAIMQENRNAFRNSVDNFQEISSSVGVIAKRLERGEGTLGKLLQENELYDSLTNVSTQAGKSMEVVGKLRTYMDFHTEYNTKDEEWKGYFELTLQPRDDKYYILGVTTDPMGSVETIETTTNSVLVREEKIESKIEFTAQYARRFDNTVLRVGFMENTFGAGADYFFNNDAGRVKFDIWDMGADEARASEPHARIGVDYRVFKFLFVSGGVDNILNSRRRGMYVGGGLKFEDEDLKYLLGSMPGVSLR